MKNFNYYNSTWVVVIIVCLTSAIHFIRETMFDLFGWHWNMGTGAVVLFFFFLYQKYIWSRFPIPSIIDLPNLKGGYYGKLVSSNKILGTDINIQKDCLFEIHQQGNEIIIVGFYADENALTATSRSESHSYVVASDELHQIKFIYNYTNSPLIEKDMYGYPLNKHEGTSTLTWSKINSESINIEYYNKERNSMGRIDLIKISETYQNKFYRP